MTARNQFDSAQFTLPRPWIHEDEMTRPCVVLYDWNGDDEATVRVSPEEERSTLPPPNEELDELDIARLRPSWRGVGRRPGVAALGAVLVVCMAIGFVVLFDFAASPAANEPTLVLQR